MEYPKLNDYVWVYNYIDFDPKKRELFRVKQENGKLYLHGYIQNQSKWGITEAALDLKSNGCFLYKKVDNFTWEAHFLPKRNESYPVWVCNTCATKAGGKLKNKHACYHYGTCDVCKQNKTVTEPRDYGYPKFNK